MPRRMFGAPQIGVGATDGRGHHHISQLNRANLSRGRGAKSEVSRSGDGSTASLATAARLFVVQRERFALMKSRLIFATSTAPVALIAFAGSTSAPSRGGSK